MDKQVSIAGCVTYWSLPEYSDAAKLRTGLEALGLAAYAPVPPTPLVAMRTALADVFKKRRHLVRPLEGQRYAVVEETIVGVDDLDYRVIFRVSSDEQDHLTFDDPTHPAVPAFEDAYAKLRRQVPAAAVGAALAQIAMALAGVRLRETGGVFWIPPGTSMDRWEAVAGVVAEAATEGRAVVYRLRTAIDEAGVQAVSDAITKDVEDAVAAIGEKLKDQERRSSFERRKEEAVALDARIATYERVLGLTLEGLRAKAKQAEQDATLAVLAALGGE